MVEVAKTDVWSHWITLDHFEHSSSAETLGWRQGLDKKLKHARAFYALILLSTGVGVGVDFVGINPVKALYWTAVINGLLAPFLLGAILVIASDKKLMQGQPSSPLGWTVVAITTVAMFAAGVAMFVCRLPNSLSSRRSPVLAKVIVRTVQFGPAGPFLPGLCCIYRAEKQS
jgi:hypothetical protein